MDAAEQEEALPGVCGLWRTVASRKSLHGTCCPLAKASDSATAAHFGSVSSKKLISDGSRGLSFAQSGGDGVKQEKRLAFNQQDKHNTSQQVTMKLSLEQKN